MRRLSTVSLALLAIASVGLARADQPDRLIADFEGGSYAGWAVEGTAFGAGPARGTLPNQMPVSGYMGAGLVNSYNGGDASTGSLVSPAFTIDRGQMHLLVGGGRQPNDLHVDLLVDDQPVRTASGDDNEWLRWVSWDVRPFQGKSARIRIVDEAKGGWGHINVDQILLADGPHPAPVDDRAGLIERAEASVLAASERVRNDPTRPIFHVLSRANWINDPNGPLYANGMYHLFYQHNPYGDDWGNMHWGHARSKDLVTWEHQPIALWPSKALGEDHIFSGSAIVRADGTPMIFYTSIGPRAPEQWAAVAEDADLVHWKKLPANPILSLPIHGDTQVAEWRDPYVVRHDGHTWLVCGGNTNNNAGGQGKVFLYEATDDSLTKWDYRGELFTHPWPGVKNVECPIFLPLGDRWLLITSQGQPVDWFVGRFDAGTYRFTPEAQGQIDGGQVYAPSVLNGDPQGRAILWGWINGVTGGKGWRHCLSLPRVLALDKSGRLVQVPAPELAALRQGSEWTLDAQGTGPGYSGKGPLHAELQLTLSTGDPANPVPARVVLNANAEASKRVGLEWDGKFLSLGKARAEVAEQGGKPLTVRVFIDGSIVEALASDGSAWVTQCVDALAEGVAIAPVEGREADHGGMTAPCKAWTLRSIWTDSR